MIKNLIKNANNPVDKIKKKKKKDYQNSNLSRFPSKVALFLHHLQYKTTRHKKKAKNQNPAPHKTMQSN